MAEKKPEKCAHPGCECTAAKDSKYCSEYCEMVAVNHLSIACECGHAECAAGETVGGRVGRGSIDYRAVRFHARS